MKGRMEQFWCGLVLGLATLLVAAGCGSAGQAPAFPVENEGGAPAEQNIGERVFVDTRFAEFFAANMVDVNTPLVNGDPVVATTPTAGSPPRTSRWRATSKRHCGRPASR